MTLSPVRNTLQEFAGVISASYSDSTYAVDYDDGALRMTIFWC